ncbi:MAG: hypothetical protein J7M30_13735 [Deltaproteobacteria bacterium]|nr:hypothetical protein [Deltaproteobacteria bacterium]
MDVVLTPPLWDFMAKAKECGALKIHVPRSGSPKARDTYVDIRFEEIELNPPGQLSILSLCTGMDGICSGASGAKRSPICN